MTAKHVSGLKIWWALSGMMLTLVMLHHSAWADSDVKFHGTLMAAYCTPDAMDVNFGEVSLDNIFAVRSSKILGQSVVSPGMATFTINLTCSGNIHEIQYKWSGTEASFKQGRLATDVTGLAIEIGDVDTSSVVPPNVWQTMDGSVRTKNMNAILIRDPTATFTGGAFNATATFTIQVP